jgi:glycosyltransferase involved in cell wall biosynthesis
MFIDVIHQIIQRGIIVKVLIIGDGELNTLCKAKIKKLDLNNNIYLLGRKNDINIYYSLFDILLLTSEFEGTPNVLIEAQALGVPCVTTDVGASGEVVSHKKTGFVINPNDQKALVDSCISLLLNDKMRKAFSQEAIMHTKQKYSSDNGVDKVLDLYNKKTSY